MKRNRARSQVSDDGDDNDKIMTMTLSVMMMMMMMMMMMSKKINEINKDNNYGYGDNIIIYIIITPHFHSFSMVL